MEGGQVGSANPGASLAEPQDEVTLGMIPRAIDMIFEVSSGLKDRGWKYVMEGQYLEVYNEVVSCFLFHSEKPTDPKINDLLGSGQLDAKKHEIKLDKDGKVSVTDIVSSGCHRRTRSTHAQPSPSQ